MKKKHLVQSWLKILCHKEEPCVGAQSTISCYNACARKMQDQGSWRESPTNEWLTSQQRTIKSKDATEASESCDLLLALWWFLFGALIFFPFFFLKGEQVKAFSDRMQTWLLEAEAKTEYRLKLGKGSPDDVSCPADARMEVQTDAGEEWNRKLLWRNPAIFWGEEED